MSRPLDTRPAFKSLMLFVAGGVAPVPTLLAAVPLLSAGGAPAEAVPVEAGAGVSFDVAGAVGTAGASDAGDDATDDRRRGALSMSEATCSGGAGAFGIDATGFSRLGGTAFAEVSWELSAAAVLVFAALERGRRVVAAGLAKLEPTPPVASGNDADDIDFRFREGLPWGAPFASLVALASGAVAGCCCACLSASPFEFPLALAVFAVACIHSSRASCKVAALNATPRAVTPWPRTMRVLNSFAAFSPLACSNLSRCFTCISLDTDGAAMAWSIAGVVPTPPGAAGGCMATSRIPAQSELNRGGQEF
mmetsp:Transcript_89304/g.251370  ORF Transcript_89304/g.251370 Transcript_89304/m.251370 type:complete len:307 (+) Transcript_89304:1211-2131(+)